jgi:hypothetical protein
MRFIALLLAGCASTPSAPPPPASAAAAPVLDASVTGTCVPLGTWTLTTRASCAHRPERWTLTVHAGPPDARDPRPLFEVTDPIVVAGHTTTNSGYERLLRVTNPRQTANGCEMDMHMEYFGPHEGIEYKARITLAQRRFSGTGTYTFLVEDCQATDPDECTCESQLSVDGEAQS